MNETKQTKQTPPSDDQEPAKITFSLPQILSGALAAVTVAAVGSSLGTAGTIIGAALASVVGAVAGTLYTVGLHHTTRGIRTVAQRGLQRVRGSDQATDPASGADPTIVMEQVPDIFRDAVGEPPPVERTRRAMVLRVLVSAAAIFLLAFAAITVYELTVGAALDGSKGTTIGGSQRTASTAKPSASPSATPKSTPTVTVTATAAPTPTATAPTATPTVTVTTTPTAVAEPSTAPEPTTVVGPVTTQASTP